MPISWSLWLYFCKDIVFLCWFTHAVKKKLLNLFKALFWVCSCKGCETWSQQLFLFFRLGSLWGSITEALIFLCLAVRMTLRDRERERKRKRKWISSLEQELLRTRSFLCLQCLSQYWAHNENSVDVKWKVNDGGQG
jgi:hypothetical protein